MQQYSSTCPHGFHGGDRQLQSSGAGTGAGMSQEAGQRDRSQGGGGARGERGSRRGKDIPGG